MAPLIVPSRARVDDVILLVSRQLCSIEGSTGRELWRVNFPSVVTSGVVVNLSKLILVDSSLQRLMIVDLGDGRFAAQLNLPGRAIGAPVTLSDQNSFILAYDTGRIEIRDSAGAVIRSGDAGSAATTAPIFIRSATGNLVLVGTRDGLTALTASDLRPLGRVVIRDQAPRGRLMAQDLDGDGNIEVIMTTMRGHVVAVTARDGRIVWDVAADADSLAFADVNNDHVVDVFVTGSQGFAVVLSGRDGSLLWKDSTVAAPIANHVDGGATRSVLAIPFGSGALLIASEPSRAGLRAIGFPKAVIRPGSN
jgi:outer membrane protein assembly factor BamB